MMSRWGPRSPDGVNAPSKSARVMLVGTSLARSSEGGYSFLGGLISALAQDDSIHLTLVLPRGHQLAEQLPSRVKILPVAPARGMARILRDIIMAHAWARRASTDLVVIPHEWAAWPGLRNRSMVAIVQNVLYLHPEGRRLHPVKGRIMSAVARGTSKWVDHTIAVSPEAAELWRRTTGLASVLVKEGVDSSFAHNSRSHDRSSVLIVSGPHPHKNPQLALEIARALKDDSSEWCVHVLGLGADATQAPGPGIHDISVTGRVNRDQLSTLFASTSVVVVTSLIESFGLPAFEARAAGCAVVVGPRTPMSYWLRSDPGVTVTPSWQANDWVACINRAARNDQVQPNTGFLWEHVGAAWGQQFAEWALTDRTGNLP